MAVKRRTTSKQQAASRRNLEKARAAKKRGGGMSSSARKKLTAKIKANIARRESKKLRKPKNLMQSMFKNHMRGSWKPFG